MSVRTQASEFPDFDRPMPTLDGFSDSSWHNDTCPSLMSDDETMQIWCDYADQSKREMPDMKLYGVTKRNEDGSSEELLSTDSWDDVVKTVESFRF